jgi:integrase/recombinase XerD
VEPGSQGRRIQNRLRRTREHRLPEATLTAEEVEAVLAGPDVTTPLGLRDRAILEVFYSTAIRRSELIALRTHDIDHARRTLFVRHGKGGKDRPVPIGGRALTWISHYTDLVRPTLANHPDVGVLFLSAHGGPLCGDWLSRTVAGYITAGAPTKRGSCHLFRHTAATLMLDGGADIRYVGEMLGHAKLETTQIYTRVSIAKLRAVHAATHPAGDGAPSTDSEHLRAM